MDDPPAAVVADAVAAAAVLVPPADTKTMKTFTGKLALVTGGSSGIGLEISKKLAALGCSVGILSRDAARLEKSAAEIRGVAASSTVKVTTIQCDVSQHELVSPAISKWINTEGVPDLVINSVGIGRPGLFEDLDLALFRQMVDTNYMGDVCVTKAVLPGMLSRGSGHIVFISSVAGFMGMYGYTSYAPTKFAVRGFADSLRMEVADRGIQLSVVFPPDTETPGLEYEKPFQPPVLIAMNENAPALKANVVAEDILKGIQRNRYIITPGNDSSMYFQLVGLLGGGLVYKVLDLFLDDAKRKVARNKAKYTR